MQFAETVYWLDSVQSFDDWELTYSMVGGKGTVPMFFDDADEDYVDEGCGEVCPCKDSCSLTDS